MTRVVNESRFERGNGDEEDVTYLFGDAGGMFTTVVLPYNVALIFGCCEIGIEDKFRLPSIELRMLRAESGRLKLLSSRFFVIDDGPLEVIFGEMPAPDVNKLLVLFVRLLFEGGPADVARPLGGFAAVVATPFIVGILLGFVRFGVSGHFSC